jgi:hypothetical protein
MQMYACATHPAQRQSDGWCPPLRAFARALHIRGRRLETTTMKTITTLPGILVCVILLSLSVAHAQSAVTSETSGALMLLGGTIQEVSVAKTTAADALTAAGWTVKDIKFTDKDIAATTRCLTTKKEAACVKSMLQRHGVARLAVVKLAANKEFSELAIHVQLVASGVDSVQKDRFCTQCTDDTLKAGLAIAVKQATDSMAIASGRTVLEIRTSPTGAMFSIDGEMYGVATDTKVAIAPGVHKLKFGKAGFAAVEREVMGVEGVTALLEVTLVPSSTGDVHNVADGSVKPIATPGQQNGKPAIVTAPVVTDHQPSRLLPGILIGAGVVGLGTGAVLIWVQKNPDRPPPTETRTKTYYFGSKPIGIATGIAGAAALLTGIYLWKRDDKTSSNGPVAMPTRDGGVLGWAGSF